MASRSSTILWVEDKSIHGDNIPPTPPEHGEMTSESKAPATSNATATADVTEARTKTAKRISPRRAMEDATTPATPCKPVRAENQPRIQIPEPVSPTNTKDNVKPRTTAYTPRMWWRVVAGGIGALASVAALFSLSGSSRRRAPKAQVVDSADMRVTSETS